MKTSRIVQKILSQLRRRNPGVKANLCRMLMEGKLGGTGKMIILPVDQGFEHGPARSFAPNPAGYDPALPLPAGHRRGLSPMPRRLARSRPGPIPLPARSPRSSRSTRPTADVGHGGQEPGDHGQRGRCAAAGLFGHRLHHLSGVGHAALDMFEEIVEMRREAAAKGVATVIWSYPRGEAVTKDGETAIDVAAYAAHIAALLGAHIIKIKLSTDHLMQPEAKKVYEAQGIDISTQAARVRHCVQSVFNGRRIIVFSGGAAKGEDAVYDDARAIRDGGGNGSIIGRNSLPA
jgi:fructose-bisphosphate aldolase, class I